MLGLKAFARDPNKPVDKTYLAFASGDVRYGQLAAPMAVSLARLKEELRRYYPDPAAARERMLLLAKAFDPRQEHVEIAAYRFGLKLNPDQARHLRPLFNAANQELIATWEAAVRALHPRDLLAAGHLLDAFFFDYASCYRSFQQEPLTAFVTAAAAKSLLDRMLAFLTTPTARTKTVAGSWTFSAPHR